MSPAPPKMSAANLWFVAAVVIFAATGISAVVFFFNPAAHHFYPVCQFHRLTGLNCPGCGGTRSFYALLHGDVVIALKDNALFVLGVPCLLARGGWSALNRWRGRPNGDFFPAKFVIPLLVLIFAFGILRNLRPFAFLSP